MKNDTCKSQFESPAYYESPAYLNRNKVKITELLVSIQVFHEVIAEEYPEFVQCHPNIVLHSDGSGRVEAHRGKGANYGKVLTPLEAYEDKEMYKFRNLKDLVKKAKELVKKHKLDWIDWNYKY